jgi:enoyl-CoA hydratase
VFREVGENPEVRAVIFTAAGTRIFCAGLDIREANRPDPTPTEERQRRWRECLDALYDCPAPVIAAVNGAALGGGLGMVTMCDFIVASEGASFGLPEIKVGLLGGARHLSRLLPEPAVRRMLLTARPLSAQEMDRYGVVYRVTPPDQLLPTARELAAELAAFSPLAVRYGKESLNRTEFLDMREGYRVEQSYTARLQQTEDAREARTAFLEKRPPVFKGR